MAQETLYNSLHGQRATDHKMLDYDDEDAWHVICTLKDVLTALQNARSAIFMIAEGIEIESIA